MLIESSSDGGKWMAPFRTSTTTGFMARWVSDGFDFSAWMTPMDKEPMEWLKDAGCKGGPIGPPFLCAPFKHNKRAVPFGQQAAEKRTNKKVGGGKLVRTPKP